MKDQTSVMAYHNMKISGSIGTWHQRILEALQWIHYGTKGQLAEMLDATEEQVHKRLSELAKKGEIIKTKKTRRSVNTGQKQTIWALKGVDINSIN